MTEEEWRGGADPEAMIDHLASLGMGRTASGKRRLRLFSCACCRRIWQQIDADSRDAVQAGEQFADGLLGKEELAQVERGTLSRGWGAGGESSRARALWACHNVVRKGAPPKRAAAVAHLVGGVVAGDDPHKVRKSTRGGTIGPRLVALHGEERAQCDLLRCIFGTPFHPVSLNPAWLMPAVESLAHAGYEERLLPRGLLDPARLAVLSDALEEVGCTDAGILEHLRSPGPHVRGCWAVDLLTGKQASP